MTMTSDTAMPLGWRSPDDIHNDVVISILKARPDMSYTEASTIAADLFGKGLLVNSFELTLRAGMEESRKVDERCAEVIRDEYRRGIRDRFGLRPTNAVCPDHTEDDSPGHSWTTSHPGRHKRWCGPYTPVEVPDEIRHSEIAEIRRREKGML